MSLCIFQTCCILENLKTYFSMPDRSTVWDSATVAQVGFKLDREHMAPNEAGDPSLHNGQARLACRWQADADGRAHCQSLPGAYKRLLRPKLTTPFAISFPNAEVSCRHTHRWLVADTRPSLPDSSHLDNLLDRAVVLPQESPSLAISSALHRASPTATHRPMVRAFLFCFPAPARCHIRCLTSPSHLCS
jgi:hypothetical protein